MKPLKGDRVLLLVFEKWGPYLLSQVLRERERETLHRAMSIMGPQLVLDHRLQCAKQSKLGLELLVRW